MSDGTHDQPNLAQGSMMNDHTDGPRDTGTSDAPGPRPGAMPPTEDGVEDLDPTPRGGTLGEDDSAFGGQVDADSLPDADAFPSETAGDGSEQAGDPRVEGKRPPEYS